MPDPSFSSNLIEFVNFGSKMRENVGQWLFLKQTSLFSIFMFFVI